jgi:hypothetical protein
MKHHYKPIKETIEDDLKYDGMHRLEVDGHGTLYCTTEGRDNPEPLMDHYQQMEPYISQEWVVAKFPVVASLTKMIADAKKDMADEIEASVTSNPDRPFLGLSDLIETARRIYGPAIIASIPPLTIPQREPSAAVNDLHDLYRNTQNYWAFINALNNLNRGQAPTPATTTNKKAR